jgi:hypothetical protein
MANKGLTWPNFSGERRQIPGVPSPKDGYGPDVVLSLADAGMTEDEAKAAIKGTDLKIVDIKDAKTAKGGD